MKIASPQPRSRGRSLRRALGTLSLVVVVLAAGAALFGQTLLGVVAERVVERKLAGTGVTLDSATGWSLSRSGIVSVEMLSFRAGAATIRCGDIVLDIALWRRHQPMIGDASVGSCEVSFGVDGETQRAASDEALAKGTPNPVEILWRLPADVARASVERVVLELPQGRLPLVIRTLGDGQPVVLSDVSWVGTPEPTLSARLAPLSHRLVELPAFDISISFPVGAGTDRLSVGVEPAGDVEGSFSFRRAKWEPQDGLTILAPHGEVAYAGSAVSWAARRVFVAPEATGRADVVVQDARVQVTPTFVPDAWSELVSRWEPARTDISSRDAADRAPRQWRDPWPALERVARMIDRALDALDAGIAQAQTYAPSAMGSHTTLEGVEVAVWDRLLLGADTIAWDGGSQAASISVAEPAPASIELSFASGRGPRVSFSARRESIDWGVRGGQLILAGPVFAGTLGRTDSGAIVAKARLSSDALVVDHQAIAPEQFSLGIDEVRAGVVVESTSSASAESDDAEPRELVWAELRGGLAQVPFVAEARVRSRDTSRRAELVVTTPRPIECRDAVDALPRELLPTLAGRVAMDGAMTPRIAVDLPLDDPHLLELEVDGVPGSCRVTRLPAEVAPEQLIAEDWTQHVTEGVERDDVFVGPGTADYVGLGEVPAWVPASMYLSEQIHFFDGGALSPGLIERALRLNLSRGEYVYGGSTIAQQLVKNVFLRRDKTISRKLEEAIIAWRMLDVVPRWRVLELYMNCIEFGPDIYGIERAAHHYFGRRAAQLTPLQSAYLASIKPAPWIGSRHRRNGHTDPTGWLPARLEEIMSRLVEYGPFIDASVVDAARPFVLHFGESEPAREPNSREAGDAETQERGDEIVD